jgi:excisionase family DNA binding protein
MSHDRDHRHVTTYVPEDEEHAEIRDLAAYMQSGAPAAPLARPALSTADGTRLELPEPVFKALAHIATAMAHHQAVTVVPHDVLLTSQEASDILGVSRPTLVRWLRDGKMPFEYRGHHRRVRLADLLDYKNEMRQTGRRLQYRSARAGR